MDNTPTFRIRADQVCVGDRVRFSATGTTQTVERVISDSITTIETSDETAHLNHNNTVWVEG